MGTCLRRYCIQKWEQKFKCSHSSMQRTTTISCFNIRKFIFWTCHSESLPISWAPACSALLPNLWRRWWIFTWYSPVDDILARCLSSIAEEENDDNEEHFPTVPLDDDFWTEEPLPERHLCIHENSQHDLCSYPCLTVWIHYTSLKEDTPTHKPQWHLWIPWCYGICQRWWHTQPRRYPWTLKKIQTIVYKISSWRRTLKQPVIHTQITYVCCLIKDVFKNSGTAMCNLDMQTDKLQLYLKVL